MVGRDEEIVVIDEEFAGTLVEELDVKIVLGAERRLPRTLYAVQKQRNEKFWGILLLEILFLRENLYKNVKK